MKMSKLNCDAAGVDVRRLRIEDYDALLVLWLEARLPHRPKGRDKRDNIARELTRPSAMFFVAEKNGRLIGSAFGTHDGRKGWINRVAVAPDYQRRGIAAKLVKEVESRLRDAGIGIIACLIEDWNTASIGFFQKIGYQRRDDIIYFTKRMDPEI
jgi:ribosomal protein S18 acetylase RimI-like enzyme